MSGMSKRKPGIVYIATIPEKMNVSKIREIFSQFGRLGNVYLELDKTSKKKKNMYTEFKEGWVEFERKTVAKFVAAQLHNQPVSTRKGSRHYDLLWNIKYLSGFKWHHLTERLVYELATQRQKRREDQLQVKTKDKFFNKFLFVSDKRKERKKVKKAKKQSAEPVE